MTEDLSWDFPNPATPEGSAAYYVARFSAVTQRARVARWLAWFEKLDQILQRSSDPGASRLKLDWWQEEAQAMLDDRARHPLAQALAGHVVAPWQVEQMCRTLQATEQLILRRQPRDIDSYSAQCLATHGSRAILLIDSEDPEKQLLAEQLGAYIATIEHLQWLRRDTRANFRFLPAELLQRHAVDDRALGAGAPLPGLVEVAETLIERHRPRGLAGLRRQTELHPLLRQVAQARRLERRLRQHRFASHQQRIALTPIGLLWSAWRMR